MLLRCSAFNCLPTNGVSIKPLKVKLLAGEQKATEKHDCVGLKNLFESTLVCIEGGFPLIVD